MFSSHMPMLGAHNYARRRHFTNPSILERPLHASMPQHLPTHIPPLTRLLHLTLLHTSLADLTSSQCKIIQTSFPLHKVCIHLPAESMRNNLKKTQLFYSLLIFGL